MLENLETFKFITEENDEEFLKNLLEQNDNDLSLAVNQQYL